jgi:hypothetical protein
MKNYPDKVCICIRTLSPQNFKKFEECRQLLLLRSDGINQQNCTVPSYTYLGLVGPVIVYVCAVFFVEVSSPIFFSTFLVYDRTELCVEYWGF